MKLELFEQGFEALCDRYSKEKLMENQFVTDAYLECLGDLTDRQFSLAIKMVLKKEPFFPTAEKILEYAGIESDRPPGENYIGNLGLKALPSAEDFLTPEDIADKVKRGRLTASIVVNSLRFHSPEEREKLEKDLAQKPMHELEAIAAVAKRVQKIKPRDKMPNLKPITDAFMVELQNRRKLFAIKDEEEIEF